VIFDVDGTLVDSNDAHARAWVDAFAEHGIVVAYDQVRRAIGMGGDKLMPRVSGIEEDSAAGKPIVKRRQEIFKDTWLPRLHAFKDTRTLVQRLVNDGFTLAIASSASDEELHPLLEAAGVADLIPIRTSSDDADRSKPDPDIVTAALRRAGCPRDRTVMIGDTPYDVEAALRARIQIIALTCGGWDRTSLKGAAAIYNDPADLLAKYQSSILARLTRDEGPRVTSPAD
jgi:phosphoglycolate phosphatase-like HAD superfamily hydrolase